MAFVVPLATGVSFAVPYFSTWVGVTVATGHVTVSVGLIPLLGAAAGVLRVACVAGLAVKDTASSAASAVIEAASGTGGGKKGGRHGGKKGGRRDGGDDDDGDDGFFAWLGKAKVKGGKFGGRILYKINKSTWVSKDSSNHGGAAFKQWIEKGRGLHFAGSLDEYMKPIRNKHESCEGAVILYSYLKYLIC